MIVTVSLTENRRGTRLNISVPFRYSDFLIFFHARIAMSCYSSKRIKISEYFLYFAEVRYGMKALL